MNKIKNNILIKNIIMLLLSGVISKLIGMISKIMFTRKAGINIVSLYSLIIPCFMLFMTLCQFSLPISISKLSAENKYDDKKLLINAYEIGFIIDIILMIIIIIFSKAIASMLNNPSMYKCILSIVFIIPFVTISSVQRGFLHGKEKMLWPSITNITEEIIKIILIISTFKAVSLKSDILSIITLILYNVVTEISTIIILHNKIKKMVSNKKASFNIKIVKDILKISIPTTLIRLISSIGFFLEPIILTYLLLKTGFNSKYITLEYGIINSYVIPILSMPSFFSSSIASALLPNITKLYNDKKYKEFNNKLLKLLLFTLYIGIISIIIILLFPKKIMKLIYGVNYGINYLYFMGPFFILLYIQPVLSIGIQAINKTNKLLYVSISSVIVKFLVLFFFALFKIGINSLIASIISGIIITTTLLIKILLLNINKRPS